MSNIKEWFLETKLKEESVAEFITRTSVEFDKKVNVVDTSVIDENYILDKATPVEAYAILNSALWGVIRKVENLDLAAVSKALIAGGMIAKESKLFVLKPTAKTIKTSIAKEAGYTTDALLNLEDANYGI